MHKTCPACSARLPAAAVWRMNTGSQFSCSECDAVLGWRAGGLIALVVLIAFVSVPAFIWLAGHVGVLWLVIAILVLIAASAALAIRAMHPVLLRRP